MCVQLKTGILWRCHAHRARGTITFPLDIRMSAHPHRSVNQLVRWPTVGVHVAVPPCTSDVRYSAEVSLQTRQKHTGWPQGGATSRAYAGALVLNARPCGIYMVSTEAQVGSRAIAATAWLNFRLRQFRCSHAHQLASRHVAPPTFTCFQPGKQWVGSPNAEPGVLYYELVSCREVYLR